MIAPVMIAGFASGVVCVALMVLFMFFGFCAGAAPGDLDPSFGVAGKVRIGFSPGSSGANAVVGQPDGKIVSAGWSYQGGRAAVTILRHHANGSLDTSFDGDGMVTLFVGSFGAFGTGVVLQGDGRIVVGGYADGESRGFILARLNADGAPDRTFGSNGIVRTTVANAQLRANAVAIQPDGSIVLAGEINLDFAAARYHPNGQLDNSFGDDGIAIHPLSPSSSEARALLIQPDGKLVLAGYAYVPGTLEDFALVRLHPDGSLDGSFGSIGMVTTDISGWIDVATSIALQSGDGTVASPDRLVVAGYSDNLSRGGRDFAAVRYALDGSRDNSFDGDGKVTTMVERHSHAYAVTVTGAGTDARITVAGTAGPESPDTGFGIVRYQADGSLDTTFGGDGIVATPLGNRTEARAMAFSGTVVAGWSSNQFTILRYNDDGSLNKSFDGDGQRTDFIGQLGFAVPHAVAVQPDGRIVVAGNARVFAPQSPSSFALLRLTPAGALDPSFGNGGKVNAPPESVNESLTALVLQSDGKIIAAGSAGTPFFFRRYHADGALDIQGGTGFTFASYCVAAALQPDGKLLMAGHTLATSRDWDVALVRFNVDGSLDPELGGTGRIKFSLGTESDWVDAIAIQPDGKIVLAGMSLARCHPDGSLDNSFDFDGRVSPPGQARAIALHEGKILFAYNGVHSIAVVRYHSDGSIDTSFGSEGSATSSFLENVRSLAVQNDGKILVTGRSLGPDTNLDFTVVRFHPDGFVDTSYGIGGKATVSMTNGRDDQPAIAIDREGNAILAGDSEGLFGMARLLSDPRLTIFRNDEGVEVTWPGAAIGYVLESQTELFGNLWNEVPDTRTTNRIFVPTPAAATFYRLRF